MPPSQPAAQPPPQRVSRASRSKRQRVPDAPQQQARRKRQHDELIVHNRAALLLLGLNNNNVRLRTYQGATPLHLYATAQRAASLADTHAHIQTTTRHLSHPLWQQSRTWDPDDYM